VIETENFTSHKFYLVLNYKCICCVN